MLLNQCNFNVSDDSYSEICVEAYGGTLWWDFMVGLYGGTLWWDFMPIREPESWRLFRNYLAS